MKSKKAIFVFILILVLNVIPVFAPWEVREIEDGASDQFQSEAGNVFDNVDFLTLKDPSGETKVALRFKGLSIDRNAKINGANLSFMDTSGSYPFEADSQVLIYGFMVDQVYPFPDITQPYPAVPPWGLPLTSAFTIWNTSQVNVGNTRFNVTVTDIVKQIVNRYGYVEGNAIGFLLVGQAGEIRSVFASEFTPYRGPILYIEHDKTPVPTDPEYPDDIPPPAPGFNATFTNTTISGLDIWNITFFATGPKDMIYSIPRGYAYYRLGSGMTPVTIAQESAPVLTSPTVYGVRRQIIRASDIIYASIERVDVGARQVYLANSTDFGQTWNILDQVSNFTGMNGTHNKDPTIGIDSNGVIHIVWCANNGTEFLAHAYKNPGGNWTLDPISSVQPNLQYPNIFIDEANDIHVSFSARNASFVKKQVYYTNNTGGTWKTPVRISTNDAGNNLGSSVSAYTVQNGTSYVGIAWTRWDQAGDRYCYFREKTESSWTAVEEPTPGAGQSMIAMVMNYFPSDNYSRSYQVAYLRTSGIELRVMFKQRLVGSLWTGWDEAKWISDADTYDGPAITRSLAGDYFIAYTDQLDDLYSYSYFYANRTAVPHALDKAGTFAHPSLPYSATGILNVTWIAVDENGTTIFECETEECLIDQITAEDPDPDDPEPGYWAPVGGLDRFRIKMIMFVLGLIMLCGAPLFGFAMKPSASTWIGIFFSMICGWGLIIAMINT